MVALFLGHTLEQSVTFDNVAPSVTNSTKLRHVSTSATLSWQYTQHMHATGVVFEGRCTYPGPQWESGRCSILVSPGSPASLPEARRDSRGGWGWGGAASGRAPP